MRAQYFYIVLLAAILFFPIRQDKIDFTQTSSLINYVISKANAETTRGKRRRRKRRSSSRGGHPVAPLFKKNFRVCAPGCRPVAGFCGDSRHQKKGSCHNNGHAVDVYSLKCGRKKITGTSSRFKKFANCMKRRMKTIYGSGSHKGHAHFQTRGCKKVKGKQGSCR